MDGGVDFTNVAKQASKALIGKAGIPDCVGAMILGQIFPPEEDRLPSYFKQVYAQIQNIVRDELINADVEKVTATVNGIRHWLQSTYLIMKDNPDHKSELD